MSRALIFDCDGVLADTEVEGHLVAFNALFAELGIGVEWSTEEYATLVEIAGGKERLQTLFRDRAWVRRQGLPLGRRRRAELVAAWHARKTAIFLDLVDQGRLPVRPGVARLAGAAHAAGWQVAVASTASREAVQAVVARTLPIPIDEVHVFAGDVVPRKKPAPDVYALALEVLGVDPGGVCVVEDSAQGLAAARRAGCPVIVTVSALTGRDDFTGAALVVDSLGDPGRPMRVLGSAPWVEAGDMVTLDLLERVMHGPGPGKSPARA